MIQCIIFDLSEVLIAGLVGVEKELSQELSVPEDKILPCFAGSLLEELCLGNVSEDTYLEQIVAREGWKIGIAKLKTAIRNNFHSEVEGSLPILMDLASRYDLVLLSDHAREWVSYIRFVHPFLKVFKRTFFSYDSKKLKNDPATFSEVLRAMSLLPDRCLFIDDNPKNITVAESVGISSIRFVNAEQLVTELKRNYRLSYDAFDYVARDAAVAVMNGGRRMIVEEKATVASSYFVTPEQTLSVAWQAGLGDEQLALSGIAVLTFNKGIMDRLEELCGLEDAEWLSGRYHPYSAAEIVKRGVFQGLDVIALVPPMGASPMACIVEDLVACGAKVVFLACAAWSLGAPVQFGDLIVPTFSLGPDGTSIHYGNTSGHIQADPAVVKALEAACRERGAAVHVGGNASCEALYRITPQMVEDFRKRGCLCMENGEASTLFAVTQTLGVPGGAIFQPYIELAQGWDPARLRDGRYVAACRLQAEVVLEAGIELCA